MMLAVMTEEINIDPTTSPFSSAKKSAGKPSKLDNAKRLCTNISATVILFHPVIPKDLSAMRILIKYSNISLQPASGRQTLVKIIEPRKR